MTMYSVCKDHQWSARDKIHQYYKQLITNAKNDS